LLNFGDSPKIRILSLWCSQTLILIVLQYNFELLSFVLKDDRKGDRYDVIMISQ